MSCLSLSVVYSYFEHYLLDSMYVLLNSEYYLFTSEYDLLTSEYDLLTSEYDSLRLEDDGAVGVGAEDGGTVGREAFEEACVGMAVGILPGAGNHDIAGVEAFQECF